ncbi:MAG: tetratricopeptide repeat protein [Candidatus Eisenbacteria bacterium]
MSKRCLIALLLVLSLPTGCVYYNTFYHARAAAREAELLREVRAPDTPPGPAEKELLERVAEKCGRVLHLHPDSGWADDALLLLGTTHYHQERYESAEQRLTEFLSLYPDSGLLPEAQYMLASVFLERGNPVSAEKHLAALAEASPPHPLSDDALALIGRARHDRKKYTEASEAYEQALERFPGGDRRAEIRFLSAQNYEEMGDLEAAARQYALVPSEQGARNLAFEGRMRLATVDLLRGLPSEALEVLGDLERRTDNRDELDRVLLLKGSALEARGAVDDAITTYEGIAASHKKSDASAEAHYRIGLLHRDHHERLDEANASFRTAKDESPRSDIATRATEAVRDIDRLVGFLATIAGGSAQPTADAGSEAPAGSSGDEMAPPEGVVDDATRHLTFLPTFDNDGETEPSSATVSATDAPDVDTIVPDSIRAAAAEPDSTDVAAAEPDTTDAVAPDTTDAVANDIELVGDAADTTAAEESEDEMAVARFRAAELYLFRFDDAERARTYYASVVEHHSDSSLAPKAALALAWILEMRLNDISGARAAYESIIADYPGSDFAAASEEHLERMGGADTD